MLSLMHFLLFSFLALTDVANAWANPLPCTGLCGNSHDPSVIRRSDGTYFRFSTGGKISVATAPSMSGPWVARGVAIPAGSKINKKGRDDMWAPDVTRLGNLFCLLYTVSSFGTQDSAIGYATSPNLETWTDHGATGVSSSAGKNYNAIDGNLVRAGGDNYFIAFGSFWANLFISPLSISDAGRTIKASSNPKQIAFTPVAPQAIEAAYIFPYRGSWYLFFSEGVCCKLDKNRPPAGKEYQIKVCRSSRPDSGFMDRSGKDCRNGGGTTLLATHGNVYAPGGQGAMNDPVEGPVIYYHYVDKSIGYADGQKKFGWNKLNFGADGWPTV